MVVDLLDLAKQRILCGRTKQQIKELYHTPTSHYLSAVAFIGHKTKTEIWVRV